MMKRLLFSFFSIVLFSSFGFSQFTAGNIAILQAEANANNTTASVIEVNKTTAAQAPVSTITIPSTGGSAIRVSGSASSTMYLSHTNDRSLLSFNGANTATATGNINTFTARGVVSLNATGTVNLATTYTGASSDQTRSSTSLNNSDWFIADQGGIFTNGTSTASPSANVRGIKPFGGIVYVGQSSSTGTVIQVSTVSAASGGAISGLPGLSNKSDLQDFYLVSSGANGTAYDILYVTSGTTNTAGVISKFSLVSGTWTANGTAATTFGGFGLAAEKNGTGAYLYITTGAGAQAANSLIRLYDETGYNAPITINSANNITLYTAATGKLLKGVDFVPTASALPTVSLSVSSNTGTEAAATVITVTATASSPVTGAQSVDLAVTGTNITTGDYTLSATTINIANGATTGTVTFTVTDDAIVEGDETAVLTISNPSSGITLGSPVTQNILITDNDTPPAPTVALSVSSNSGSEASASSITVTATASAAVSGDQTVTLAITGAGIASDDYVLSNNTITILNGQTSGSVTFVVRNDATLEGTETATLTISNPSAGITIGSPASQNIAITDNTCQPLIHKSTATSANGAEISAFDPASSRIYTIAGPVVEYYMLSSTATLSTPTAITLGFTPAGGTNAVPNSVAIRNGVVAVSYAIVNTTTNAQQPGVVAFYTASTGAYINHVTVGYLPDMVIFHPDGTKVLTANEGEPNSYGQGDSFDPEGSVSIIDISAGVASATVQTAGFTSFNAQINALRAAGVRIYGPGATVAQDVEPEYIAFSGDGTKAVVTLQENNAFAEVDIATATVTQIVPLGLKNHSLTGNGLDASDRDLAPAYSAGTINIQNWPIYGMYQPDAISSFTVAGNTYYITANEGDSRAYTGFSEEIRVGASGYNLDPAVFPNAATLKLNQNLGRLQLTNATGDANNDGLFEQIHAFGARSFSIWNSSYAQVFDSGDQLEQITAAQNPTTFNSEGTTATFDTRSDNKGPEPEAVTTGTVNGVLYAFVGSERTGDVFVYNISNPAAPVFLQYIDLPAEQGVEGLAFIPANQSPTGKALLLATAEVSRTVTVYEFSLVSSTIADEYTIVTTNQGTVSLFGTCTDLVAQVAQQGAQPVSGSVTAQVWIESVQPSNFVKRHYEIYPATNAAIATGRVTLYFTQQEFDDFNAINTTKLPANPTDAPGKANLLVEKRAGQTNNGTGLPTSYPGIPETINPDDAAIVWNSTQNHWEVSFDVTGFSGFFIKTIGGTLPASWLSVNGTLNTQKQAIIKWKVQEFNTAVYDIEKSDDGIRFVKIGTVNSIGEGTNEYQFTDPLSLTATGYYRIKQVDNDGRYTYSITVKLSHVDRFITSIYPNPATETIVINAGKDLLNTKAQLTDLNGRRLAFIQISGQTTSVDIHSLANGVYFIRFEDGQALKFVKQ